jgi:hypothetical protein
MKNKSPAINELDIVALLYDYTELGLVTGQVGTVVDKLDAQTVEVEFITLAGESFAITVLPVDHLLVLHYSPVAA